MKYLLGRVVVADNIDHAIALAKKYQYSLRIVTLEGELLNAGGSMTGGAFKNSSNLLGRKREIEDLEERCKKILVQVEEIQKQLNACETSLEEQKSRIEELASLKQQIYLEPVSYTHLDVYKRQAEQMVWDFLFQRFYSWKGEQNDQDY